MKRLRRNLVMLALGAAAFGTVFAPAARASCVSIDQNDAIWRLPAVRRQSGTLRPVLAKFVLDASAPDASIVGFWRVDFTPDGAIHPVDSALVQWHSDGTEIMNSSRDPRTQSFCMGVWKKTGPFTYALKHLAMSWDGAGNPVGPAVLLEDVVLSNHGATFTGTFTITQYEMDGTTVVPPTPITGSLAGTRIRPN